MKKMKKTLSLILAVIILLTAVPVQGFALFENLNPTVVKVEFADDLPVSNQAVQNSNNYMVDALGKTMVYGLGEGEMYDYKVYLSNGKVLEVKDGYYYEERPLINRIRYCSVVLLVDPVECADAIAQGKETVTTEVMVLLSLKNDTLTTFEAELEKAIVPEVVKNVSLLDSMPEIGDDYNLTHYFEGKRFEVEYSGGEKKTYILERKSGEYIDEFYLGDNVAYIWGDIEGYTDEETGETGCAEKYIIEYIDAEVAFYEEKFPCPYEKIEILDYTVGDCGVTGVTYMVTYKNGKTVGGTKTFDTIKESDGYVVIDKIGEDEITAYISCYEEDYYFGLWLGRYEWEMGASVEGETRDICGCLCHETGIKYLISVFLRRIWEVFGIKEYCECGSWHW